MLHGNVPRSVPPAYLQKKTAHAEREPPLGITIRYTIYEMIRSFVALLSTPKGVPVSPLAQRTDAGFMG